MSAIRMIYVTCSSENEALNIAKILLEERLVACANIGAKMRSLYLLKDELNQADEFPLWLKTQAKLVQKVISKVEELHSYECPCVFALPIEASSNGFEQWLVETTVVA